MIPYPDRHYDEFIECGDGRWARHSDYAALESRVKELEAGSLIADELIKSMGNQIKKFYAEQRIRFPFPEDIKEKP